jgi:hypothetical protein
MSAALELEQSLFGNAIEEEKEEDGKQYRN